MLSNKKEKRKRRDSVDLIYSILEACNNGGKKTWIMFKANLSTQQTNEYLSFLIGSGFLEKEENGDRKIYKTTDKGRRFCEVYRNCLSLLS